MPKPVVSVIMVSYHTGAVLFQAIRHVLASTTEVELCLINNGNPPDVVAQLVALAVDEPRVRLITGQGNVGFSAGCNIGAKAGRGEWLLFLNPDSLLPADALTKLVHYAANLPRPHMFGARLVDEDGRDQRGCRRALLTPTTAMIEALHMHVFFPKVRLNFDSEPIPSAIAPMPAISGAFMFLHHADFWKIGGFDEGYFLHVEDLDICLRFRRAGGEIYFVPDIVVTHIGGTSKATTVFIEKHKARGFIRYFKQHFRQSNPAFFIKLLAMAVWARAWLKIGISKLQ